MASSLNGTGITFSDSTSQSSAWIGGRGQIFTSTGTFTVPAGVTAVKVTVIGGGGGGGSVSGGNQYLGGGGGGGGGVAVKFITGLTPGSTITATVGGGGGASASGGTSSFGAYCSATGGGGGSSTSTHTGDIAAGSGGSGSSGDFNYNGCPGARGFADGYATPRGGSGGGSGGPVEPSFSLTNSAPQPPGLTNTWFIYGGRGFLGGKGGNGWYGSSAGANHAGEAGTGYGNGGSGACKYNTNYSGGSGSAGCVLVEW